jgi:predicted phage terminase large subunit-like protein
LPSLAEIRAEKAKRAAARERERVAKDAEGIRARCQTLAGFVREAWHVLEPNARYSHNWHIDAICDHLEAVTDGRINRLLINVPPGSMKSLLVSVLWQAWEWGPKGLRSLRYLTTAFNDTPVKRDTRKTRDLILSEWYRSLWPEVDLTRTGETSFANSSTGTREGVPFGSLTSQRGDRLIIDDPHSVETAESETERNTTTRKFREGAINRLNDQERSAIVVIMQRLHEDDVSGTIIKLGMGYTHLMLPLEFEPARACETEIGFKDPRSLEGDLLDPVRMPRETVEKLKRDTTAYALAGQYQQRPAPREGGIFKRHWFEFVPASPAGARKCRGWDLAASKAKVGSSASGPAYTAGVRLSELHGIYYIENAVRERGGPADVDRLIKNTAASDGQSVQISIPQDPGQAAKGQVLAFAKLLTGFNVRFSTETGDKESRALPVSAQAEVGNVKIVRSGNPERDAWIAPFLEEISMFPSGTFKDQTDALSRAFGELLKRETRTETKTVIGMY